MSKFKKAVLAVCIFLSLGGCQKEDDGEIAVKTTADGEWQRSNPSPITINNQPNRFKVERQMVFRDGLAYGGKRGIYVITDTQTGKEYIGVSGIGITEVASHNCGKGCMRSDER